MNATFCAPRSRRSLLLSRLAGGASAQTYPSRVIKIVVPFAAGGQPDTIARLIAQHISEKVGATIIDNRPGANTTIGAKAVAGAEPDGYTILFGTSTSLAIAPALMPNAGYDPVKSFTPIAAVSSSPMYLTVGPSVKAKNVRELIDFAKANPGKLNFAAPTGGPPHLAGEIFKRAAGIEMVPVSYRSMNQAFTDMMSGQMDIVFDSPAPLVPLIRDGQNSRARFARRPPVADARRCADDEGRRTAGRAGGHVERARRAGRDAGCNRRKTQCGGERRAAIADDQGDAVEFRFRTDRRSAAGFRGFRRLGIEKVDRYHPDCGCEGGVARRNWRRVAGLLPVTP